MKELVARILNIPIIRFTVTVLHRFGKNNGGIYAGALSFFMLLAFVPLVLTGVAILALFVHNPQEAAFRVDQMVHDLLPAGGASDVATHILQKRLNLDEAARGIVEKRGIAGVLGFLSLVWASLQIFINAAAAMNQSWQVEERRNWFVLRGIALALMAATGVLLILTLFLSSAPNAIAKFNLPIIHHLPVPMWTLTAVFEALAVVVNAALYVLIYKFLPCARGPWRAALVGGLTASIAWEVVKKGIAAWLLRPNHSVYGNLADLILFVLWIYYSMMILLIGAEVAAAHAEKTEAGAGKKLPRNGERTLTRGERIQKSSHEDPHPRPLSRRGERGKSGWQ
jgi:membrane protein